MPSDVSMKNYINQANELILYGEIGEWWDGLDAASVVRELERLTGDEIVVRIHSGGGYIMEGLAIYNALKNSPRRVVAQIDGLAASMASLIPMAADEIRTPANAQWLLHKPWNVIQGNADEFRDAANRLDGLEATMSEIYATRSGLSAEAIEQVLAGQGTWYNGREAVAMGFADVLLEDVKAAASVFIPKGISLPGERQKALFLTAATAATTEEVEMTQQSKPAVTASDAAKAAAEDERARSKRIREIGREAGADQAAIDDWLDRGISVEEAQTAAASIVDQSELDRRIDAAADRKMQEARQRAASIREITAKAGLTGDFANDLVDSGVSLDEARAKIIDALASETTPRLSGARVDRDNTQMRAGVVNHFLHRMSPAAHPIDENGAQFRGMSLLETGRAMLEQNGVSTRGMSVMELARAMQSTSDFPLILADVANKELRRGYEAAPRTFPQLGRRVTLRDFKPKSSLQFGEGSNLKKVNEAGEFEVGQVTESGESYSLASYGRIFAMTRQTVVNDDLGAIQRFASRMGSKAAQLENSIVWGLIEANATMSDGNALFSTEHGNLATSAGAITEARLNAGRKALRTMKGLDDNEPLGLTPKFLVVSADLETDAQKFLASITPDSAGNVNPFANSMTQITEARLADKPWYLFADPALVDTFEYAYLEGEEGVYVETREGFEVDGTQIKVRHDFAAGAVDWRGMFKNAGA